MAANPSPATEIATPDVAPWSRAAPWNHAARYFWPAEKEGEEGGGGGGGGDP